MGPLSLIHDHERGTTGLHKTGDVVDLVARHPNGLSASEAARHLFHTERPVANLIEKARRRLEKALRAGQLEKIEEPAGHRYTAATPRADNHVGAP